MNNLPENTMKALILSFVFGLAACGGGSSGGGGDGGPGPDPDPDPGPGPGPTNNIPEANAGANLDVSRTFIVNLDGSASNDADGDDLSYVWTQTKGPDVTGGAGFLEGENPSFAAPEVVDTIIFDLVVNDGIDDSPADSVVINVFEDINVTYFVDGDNGDDDAGTGSRDNPFATVSKAVSELTTNAEDIYVKTRAADAFYDETTADINIPAGTSLYGGYDNDWIRDVEENKTALNTNHRGIRFFSVSLDAWFSGFDLMTADSPDATDDVFGVFASGSASMYIHDNIINNGNVEAGEDASPGSNYGLALLNLNLVQLSNNMVTAGTGGDGIVGVRGLPGDDGDDGQNGNRTGGRRAPGGNTTEGGNGGAGGARGGGLGGDGGGGSTGGAGSAPLGGTITRGTAGCGGISGGRAACHGGSGNTGGRGVPGNAGNGAGGLISSLFFTSNGSTGGRGGHGTGGGGGGGGAANNVGVVGGGGGGGGEGGSGGFGGSGGRGGGASIGIWLHNIVTSDIAGNTINSGLGGLGATGGTGGSGGFGGSGGSGAAGDDQGILGNGGGGGRGGSGGSGGSGGYGGAGGGGPSYGVIFAGGMSPTLTGNTITSGDGGAGGNGGFRGNGGGGGYSYAVYDRDPNDAFFATLSQNTLASGVAGAGGTSSAQDTSSAGSDGQTGTRNWQ